jgi:TPP-dependent pyruvate/acetoin dehydrogenase alpha subunit
VFVCENNRYGEFTPYEDVTAGEISDRPATLGIPSITIDGNDVWKVREIAAEAVERARRGEGPQFIESMTYRFVGHSRSDPGRYRKPGELDEWRTRDPLLIGRRGLIERYGIDEPKLDALEQAVDDEVRQVSAAAVEAPFPEPYEATEFKGG